MPRSVTFKEMLPPRRAQSLCASAKIFSAGGHSNLRRSEHSTRPRLAKPDWWSIGLDFATPVRSAKIKERMRLERETLHIQRRFANQMKELKGTIKEIQTPKIKPKMAVKIVALVLLSTIAFQRSRLCVTAATTDQKEQNSLTAHQTIKVQEPALIKSEARPDHRRPIWALAHMVNSIKELEYRLEKGANGIEADVTFGRDGMPLYVYHGPPCDCWRHCYQRENFAEYLSYVRQISVDSIDGIGSHLNLLILDLKLDSLDQQAKERAGQELAKSILNNLYLRDSHQSGAKTFRLILSINHVNDIDLVRNFMHTLELHNSSHLLRDNIGFEVGMNDDLQMIESMWQKLASNNPLNLWQGDGYTNCFSPFYNLERLSKALSKRDRLEGYPSKVYHWTIDLHDRMRESLMMGVDAIMTNHPERVLAVLKEPLIAHDLRLATRDDNPFKKLSKRSAGRNNETARYQRSAYVPSGGLLNSLVDVLASWINYIKEIPFLSYPTTLVARSSTQLAKQSIGGKSSSTVDTSHLNVTQVGLQGEPVYNVLSNATDSKNEERHALAQDPSANSTNTLPEYEGPKWYTSLASNVLVSILRVVLPVN